MCGAVTGGIMALCILYGRNNAEQSYETVYEKVQQFLQAFEEEYISINCFELTGCDLSKEEGHQAFVEKGMMKKCRQFTGRAASLVAELISGEEDSVILHSLIRLHIGEYKRNLISIYVIIPAILLL